MTAQTPCGFPVFANGQEFQTGQNPFSVASGDVNNDGKLDAVTANFNSNNISVFLGTGTGNFNDIRQFGAGTFPDFVTLKDLNTDGNLDAVVLNQTDAKMTILLGNGAGDFALLTQYSIYKASTVDVADINGDAKLDLTIGAGDFNSTQVYVYPGVGDGTFATPITTNLPGSISSSLGMGDFNGDGKRDLIDSTTAMVRVWLGDGAGNFTMGWTSNQGVGKVVIGNLNNDSYPDFAVFDSTFNHVQIFTGNGDATFQPVERQTIGSVAQNLKIADLNRDGFNDIVLDNWTSNEITILMAAGGGHFNPAKYQTVSGKPRGLTVGDFSGDGIPDVVTTSFRNNSIMLTLGKGDGTFHAASNLKVESENFVNAEAAADLNGDGRDDVVIANTYNWGLNIFIRNGNYKFSAPRKYLQSTSIGFISINDFNRDGKLDIVALSGAVAYMLLGDGNGNFTVLGTFSLGSQGGFTNYVASADFNADGKLDIVVSNWDFGSFFIFLGNGDGTFGSPVTYGNNDQALLTRLDIGDFNADGKPDLAVLLDNGFSANGKVQVRLNQGNGTFGPGTDYIVGQSIHPRSVVISDFNADGKPDFAVSTITDSVNPYDLYIYKGAGNGTFGLFSKYSVQGTHPYDLVARDFNKDGKIDIATINYLSENVSVFAGNGDSTFSLAQKISTGGGPQMIVAGNFNNDRSIDLIAASQEELTILPNECQQARDSSTLFDFDGDSKTDIGIFRPSDGSWWYSRSLDVQTRVFNFGTSTDIITPGDFTGDGKTDITVFRPSTGLWFVQRSEDNSFFSFPFGTSGDVPAPADFDGDGITDAAVFRPSNSTWYIRRSNDFGTSIVTFGTSGDKPVPADFDGDGKADIAIFRQSDGSWWYLRSIDLQYRVFRFGLSTDKPVQGDYTGDGRADIAVFRPSTGEWFVQRSEDNSYYSVPFGSDGDLPAPGDYDGDGRADTAVFRPSTANWFVNRSTSGILITSFGSNGDRPIPNAFVP